MTPTPTRVLVPHLIAEVPEGWAALDVVELYGPSGIQVRVTAENPEPGWDTSDLAERHAAALNSGPEDYEELDLAEERVFGGHLGLRRSARFTDGSTPYRGVSLYLMLDGVGYVASITGPESAISRLSDDLNAVTNGLTLLSSPHGPGAGLVGGETEPTGATSVPPSRSPRPERAATDWSAVRSRWAAAASGSAAPVARELPEGSAAITLTIEELAVVAALLDVPRFPSVSPLVMAAHRRDTRTAVARALVASLRARGLIDTTGESPSVAEPLGSLAEVALFPDLFVEVEVHDVDGSAGATHAWCVRPETSVSIDGTETGTRTIGSFETGGLVRSIAGALDAARAHDGARFTFRSTWRDGRQLVGGELTYRVDGSTIVDELGVTLGPTDIVEDLFAHLP